MLVSSVRGGRTYVTKSSGDFGIDIEEHADEGLYLGQVKCTGDQNPIGYEPIAIIHSQMAKQDAIGGYVVTTGRFTDGAYEYANGLNIELIDGQKLVDLWIRHLEGVREEDLSVVSPAT